MAGYNKLTPELIEELKGIVASQTAMSATI